MTQSQLLAQQQWQLEEYGVEMFPNQVVFSNLQSSFTAMWEPLLQTDVSTSYVPLLQPCAHNSWTLVVTPTSVAGGQGNVITVSNDVGGVIVSLELEAQFSQYSIDLCLPASVCYTIDIDHPTGSSPVDWQLFDGVGDAVQSGGARRTA